MIEKKGQRKVHNVMTESGKQENKIPITNKKFVFVRSIGGHYEYFRKTKGKKCTEDNTSAQKRELKSQKECQERKIRSA